jgi:hypothetical protein
VKLGYYRGIVNKLESMQASAPQTAGFVHGMALLARQYQFETMLVRLDQLLAETPAHGH